jgi:hypothetical protein
MITKIVLDVGFENNRNQPCSKMRTFRATNLEECLSRVRTWFAQNQEELYENVPACDLPPQEGDDEFVGDPKDGITWGHLFGRKEFVVRKRQYAIAQVKIPRLLPRAR